MCGRFALDDRVDQSIVDWVADAFRGRPHPEDWIDPTTLVPRFSVTPGQPIVALGVADRGGEPVRYAAASLWGFSPDWARRPGPRPINARLETVARNGLFRTAFRAARRAVPMCGYFEWVPEADGKQPYFISSGAPLFAAGIGALDADGTPTAAILTRQAVDASGRIHDRMPVFLDEQVLDDWLRPGGIPGGTDGALAFLDAQSRWAAATMSTAAVSRAINSARTADPADPSLIEPL